MAAAVFTQLTVASLLGLPTDIYCLATKPILTNFYGMINRFKTYSDADISLLENERLRHMVFGGRDALEESYVIQAFAVLYEDVLPVRFGGDILFNMINKAIDNARTKKLKQMSGDSILPPKSFVQTSTGNSIASTSKRLINSILAYSTENMRSNETPFSAQSCHENLFYEIDTNNDGSLSFDEFQSWVESIPLSEAESSGFREEITNTNIIYRNNQQAQSSYLSTHSDSLFTVTAASNVLSTDKVTKALFSEIDINKDGAISYQEFKLWTTGALSDSDRCDADDEVLTATKSLSNTLSTILDEDYILKFKELRFEDIPLPSPNNRKHREKYFHMLKSFAEWGEKLKEKNPFIMSPIVNQSAHISTQVPLPSKGNERVEIVIQGCFEGAKNPGVIKALGILYEDYMPLRIAGDAVFALVQSRIEQLLR